MVLSFWLGPRRESWVSDSPRKILVHALLRPGKADRTRDIIRKCAIREISKHGMETQQCTFEKSSESRKEGGQRKNWKTLESNQPGGSVTRSILVPQFIPLTLTFPRESASPCPMQFMQFILPFNQG